MDDLHKHKHWILPLFYGLWQSRPVYSAIFVSGTDFLFLNCTSGPSRSEIYASLKWSCFLSLAPHPSSGAPPPNVDPGARLISIRKIVRAIMTNISVIARFFPTQLPGPLEKGWKLALIRRTSSSVTPADSSTSQRSGRNASASP